mmetsp:Transcript_62708/g.130359  ORF Transcript_62708/g.130359 Transcript_62708/m.130359 type:complete len:145 (-) Transcript_62708:7-441(-)
MRRMDLSAEEKTLMTEINTPAVAAEIEKTKNQPKTQKTLEAKIASLQKENANLKRRRDGKQRDGKHQPRKEDLSIPICANPKCWRRHKGKCILDSDLDQEQKALDFACKIKKSMAESTTASAEERALARANKVSFDDLNENSDV